MSLLLNDDILDYLKCHLDINDYDKMKKVSVKHRYLFDLKPLLFNKYYDKLLNIQGSSVEMILKIIDYNVRKKYKFKKNKTIIKKLLKYSNYIEISINNNNIFIIEYLIDILYNTSKKKYENLKNIIIELYNNDKLYYGDIGDFCASLTIITKYFKNDLDNYYNEYLELLYKLNVGILLFIIVKKFSGCADNIINTYRPSCINLFNTQNMKLDEYLEIIYQGVYADEKYFKKYYIDIIVNLMKELYIPQIYE
jgi:hypothetical protein